MVVIYRENGVLYVEAKMELRFPMVIKGVTYKKQDGITFEDVDVVYSILERNGRILIKNGEVFKRMSLGEFADILTKKEYKLVENLPVKEEPKKEEKKIVVKEEVKVEEKIEPKEEKIEEVVIETVVKEEVKVEEQQPKPDYQNNKKRNKDRQYNNNNNKPQQPKEEKVVEEKKGDDK